MKYSQQLFLTYLRQLSKRWAFWIFIALDPLGLIIGLFFPETPIPPFVFWFLAFLCMIWAGFQVYKDVPQKNLLLPKPKLSLSFMEGNEYEYSLLTEEKDRDDLEEEMLPNATLAFHLRVQNESPIKTQILKIGGSYMSMYFGEDRKKSPKKTSKLLSGFAHSGVFTEGLDGSSYPIPIDATELKAFVLFHEIRFTTHFSPAQFAARLAEIPKKVVGPTITIEIEIQDISDGEILKFETKKEVSLVPLKDKYITYWQQKGEKKLLELAYIGN